MLAQLEAHARRLETGDDEVRALPTVFRHALHPPGSHASNDDMYHGLALLMGVYDDLCTQYLDDGGIFELLDALAVCDVVHPAQHGPTERLRSSSKASTSPLGSPGNKSNSSPTAASDHSTSSAFSSAVRPLLTLDDCEQGPTLPLVRAVEAWRLFHPNTQAAVDATHRRAIAQYTELVATFASERFLTTVESVHVVRRPSNAYLLGRSGAAAQTHNQTRDERDDAPLSLGGTAEASTAQFPQAAGSMSAPLESGVGASWTVGGYTLNGQLAEDVESVHVYLERLGRRVYDLTESLASLDAAERSLALYPWTKGLQTPSHAFLTVAPDVMRDAIAALQRLFDAASIAHAILKALMQPNTSWVSCLNDNLAFLKRETTCAQVPDLVAKLAGLLTQLRCDGTSAAADAIPSIRWMLNQSTIVGTMEWVLRLWTRTRPYLTYLQRLLVVQVDTFTFVMHDEGDGQQPQMVRQVTTTPTTRFDRVCAERRSVVAWGALCFRQNFPSWEDLHETPLHRIAQQLKKLKLEKKTTFEVLELIDAQLELGTEMPPVVASGLFDAGDEFERPAVAAGLTLKDFLDQETTMFAFETRDLKFTASTVRRGK